MIPLRKRIKLIIAPAASPMINRISPILRSKAATVPAVIKALGRTPVIAAAMFIDMLKKLPISDPLIASRLIQKTSLNPSRPIYSPFPRQWSDTHLQETRLSLIFPVNF